MLIGKWMDVNKIKSITELKTESDYSATWLEYATPKLLLNSLQQLHRNGQKEH